MACGCTGAGPRIVGSSSVMDPRIRARGGDGCTDGPWAVVAEAERPRRPVRSKRRAGAALGGPIEVEPIEKPLSGMLWRPRDPRVRRPTLRERPELLAWMAAAASDRSNLGEDRALMLALSEVELTPEALPLARALARRGIDRVVLGELGSGLRETVGSTSSCAGSHVSGGRIDLCFDSRWSPATDDDTRHETLRYVWETYWEDMASTLSAGLDFAALAECVREWDVSGDLGDFWTGGSGPSGKVIIHALRLIATYVENLSDDAPICTGARSNMLERLYLNVWMDIDRYRDLGRDDAEVEWSGGLPIGFSIGADTAAGTTNTVSDIVHIGSVFVDNMGLAIDRLLWHAHRAYHYVGMRHIPGGVAGGLYYYAQARALGSLALGGISMISAVMIHEVTHLIKRSHCANNCCQERVAAKWQCRTMAQTGALQCRYNVPAPHSDLDAAGASVDLGLHGRVGGVSECTNRRSYSDECADEAPGGEGRNFCWEAQMDEPGVPSTSADWYKVGTWESPARCAL